MKQKNTFKFSFLILALSMAFFNTIQAQNSCVGVGDWSSKKWYNEGQQCVVNNHLWESVNRHRNQIPPNSNWADLGACGTTTVNENPTVSISSPANGSSVEEGTAITMSANAADADGNVSNVAFYNNGNLIGSDASAPYSFSLGILAVGNYELTAVATDNEGASTSSSSVSLTITSTSTGNGVSCAGISDWSNKKWYNEGERCKYNNHLWESTVRHRNQLPPNTKWIDLGECTTPPNVAPTTSISSPNNGVSINEGTNLVVNASASDADGSISNVAFFSNGTIVGNDGTAPYSLDYGVLGLGTYDLTVVATDNDGASTTSSIVTVTVIEVPNEAPTVSITSPTDGSALLEGAAVAVSANASDADGAVVSVQFYNNGSLVGSDAVAPYSLDLGVLPLGTYSLSAVATDNEGASTTSASISISITSTPPPSSGTHVIGYMPYWAGSASAIQYDKLTHINYSFAIPDVDGHLKPLQNTAKLQQIVSNAHAVGGKVLIAVGGWSENGTPLDSRFEAIGANATYRTNLVNDIVALVNTYNLDGADMDWEFPNAGSSADNFEALMTELYNALHPAGKLVTAAVSGSSYGGAGVNASVKNVVDWLNIMAYDFNDYQHSTYSDALSSVAYYQGKGFPNSQLALGVPFYGRNSWEAYSTITNNGGDPYADVFNGVGYNGITTIKQKTNYVIDNSLRGVMIWEISQDRSDQYSLLTAIDEEITAGGPGNQAPSASITSPTNGSAVDEGTSIVVNASASDADGSIAIVEFYSNGTLVGSDGIAPYALSLGALAVGTYNLTVVAIDDKGASTSSAVVTVTVNAIGGNALPTAAITSPTANQNFVEGAVVTVAANASDVDGSITRVEFYLGGIYQGEDVVAPYSYDLSGLAAGNYTVSVVAFDNEGASANSAAVNFVVNPISTGGCTEPVYVEGNTINTNDQIQNVGNLYNCTVGGWCSGAAWAYEPGVGLYWTDCWELVGSCTAQSSARKATFTISAVATEVETTVTIESKEDQVYNVKVYNAAGQMVYVGLQQGNKGEVLRHTIENSTWKQGYYIVTVEAGGELDRIAIVK